jgi:hypothetical protein
MVGNNNVQSNSIADADPILTDQWMEKCREVFVENSRVLRGAEGGRVREERVGGITSFDFTLRIRLGRIFFSTASVASERFIPPGTVAANTFERETADCHGQ